MPSIVTHKFRLFNADQFKESLNEAAPDYLYMFIGRVRPWSDDNSPPTPVDAVANTEYGFWTDMLSAKQIGATDAAFAVARNDWATGVVYTEYTHTNPTLFSNSFFVVTDDYNVYKCLFNNNGGASTVKPTSTSTSVVTTADDYKWKYMYTISASDALKFITDDFIPVSTLSANNGSNQWQVQQAAVNGAIDVVDVTNGGSTFNNYNSGTLAGVTNSSVITLSSGASTTDDVYVGSTLYLSGGTGAGQQKEIVNYVGSTKVATLNQGFTTTPDTATTYSVAPKVLIVGDGVNANAISTMNTSSNTVHSITMTNVGRNYSTATVTLSANGLSGATATAYISPPGGHGSDPVKELGGFNVVLNSTFDKSESGKFTTDNDFRKIGLVRNPLLANGSVATAARYLQSTVLNITGLAGTFQADELVTGGTSGATAYVMDANTSTVRVTSISANIDFSVAEVITGATSSATANVSSITSGELKKYTGELMFSEFRSPISRATDQLETIKLVIQF